MNWIVIMCIVLVVVAILAILWYKGKKNWVLNTVYNLMVLAEGVLGSKAGQEKLDSVLTMYEKKVDTFPWYIKLVVLKLFSKEKIKGYIEHFLDDINDMFKDKYHIENNFLDKLIETGVKAGKDIMLDKAIKGNFNGDKNLIDNISLIDISDQVDIIVNKEKKGIVKGYTELETNFKETQLKAGVEALYKF